MPTEQYHGKLIIIIIIKEISDNTTRKVVIVVLNVNVEFILVSRNWLLKNYSYFDSKFLVSQNVSVALGGTFNTISTLSNKMPF